jgi:hypothetical protein
MYRIAGTLSPLFVWFLLLVLIADLRVLYNWCSSACALGAVFHSRHVQCCMCMAIVAVVACCLHCIAEAEDGVLLMNRACAIGAAMQALQRCTVTIDAVLLMQGLPYSMCCESCIIGALAYVLSVLYHGGCMCSAS